jgi:triphosphoribosyl-dephospho-CoA synthetase
MDDIELFGVLQEGRETRQGVEVEAAVRHKIRVQMQGNTMESVMWLSAPTACAAGATLHVFVLEKEVSESEAQRKAFRYPHSTG